MNKLSVCLVGFLGLSVACGDSGGSGSSSGSLGGVSGSKPVSEVTPTEAQAICEDLAARQADPAIIKGTCTIEGLFAAFQNMDCVAARDACIEAAEKAGPDESDCTMAEDRKLDCPDVTVGEYKACLDEALDAQKAAFSKITCDSDLSAVGTDQDGTGNELPASCKKIQDKCPAAFQDPAGTDAGVGE